MGVFNNILYISRGLDDEGPALAQTLAIAGENDASLNVLIIYPPLPDSLAGYRATWEQGLATATRNRIEECAPGRAEAVEIQLDSPDMPAEAVIRRVLRQGFDLVVKPAEAISQGRGHKAIDMELLRKCPCPVWLAQPGQGGGSKPRVAVADDPANEEPAAVDLAVQLLKTASALSRSGGALQIISCWDCEYEAFLRHHPFARIPEDEVDQTVINFEKSHSRLLVDLVKKAAIADYDLNHIRGRAEEMIPGFVKSHGIDILVMGTVARAGIPGFVMGNTAENIVQKLSCTLLALKPRGFVSPVKAY